MSSREILNFVTPEYVEAWSFLGDVFEQQGMQVEDLQIMEIDELWSAIYYLAADSIEDEAQLCNFLKDVGMLE